MVTHPNPIIRLTCSLDRKTDLRTVKAHSKYNVALPLKNLLDGQNR